MVAPNDPAVGSDRLEALKLDAARYFDTPTDVLTDPLLSLAEKRDVLEAWRLDAARLAESADENMQGGEDAPLQAINNALLLIGDMEAEATPAEPSASSHVG